MESISEFKGQYSFLSNFHPVIVIMDGQPYNSVENAYQAAKTLDLNKRIQFETVNPGKAKRMGNALELRKDWEDVKIGIMKDLVKNKFNNFDLRDRLLATENAKLIEGNFHGDRFWGKVNGIGENHLGIILMEVRAEIRLKLEKNGKNNHERNKI